MVAELVRRYSVLGIECALIEVQKLVWFLHRIIASRGLPDPLRLTFTANRFGPYDDHLRHLLDRLDGSYLHCEKRLGDAGPFDPIWFEPTRQAAVAAFLDAEAKEFLPALEQTAAIIDGFESPLGMELLATVDWLLARAGCEATVPGLRRGLEGWPGGRTAARRKLQLFDERLLELALRRLTEVPVAGGSN